jgi:ABC-type molybdate transport system substrate-binding protein
MKRLTALLLLCTVMIAGCGTRATPQLYIYCNETFWYVMQEQALLFNNIYGFQVILIPIRAEQVASVAEEPVEIGTDRRGPVPWRNMLGEPSVAEIPQVYVHINPDIARQLERIAEEHFGDLFLSDSQRQLEQLRRTALSTNEYLVCYLTLTMFVPKGNPHHFRSIKDVLETNRKLGIVDPSLDGLGETSWQVLSKIVSGGESAIPREFVRLYERQYDLLEALEQGHIDAALVWDATSQATFLLVKYAEEYNAENRELIRQAERKKDKEELRIILQEMYNFLVETKSFAEAITLTENSDERAVVAIRLVALSSTRNYGYCERFADFMRSQQGREAFRRFGFVTR